MKRTAFVVFAAATAFAGSAMIGGPAQAATAHCDRSVYPNKVEVSDGPTTLYTGLTPGTEVCIKAGTQVVAVVVDDAGNITQDGILNPTGKAFLGISYYAYGDVCVDDLSTEENECPTGSSS